MLGIAFVCVRGGDPRLSVVLDGTPLSIDQVAAVAREGTKIDIGDGLAARMAPARAVVEDAVARGAVV